MKKLTALFLILTLVCSAVPFAFAEEAQEPGGLLGLLGSFLSSGMSDTSETLQNAQSDMPEWLRNTLGDTPEWLQNTLGDASGWLESALGDPSGWLSGKWEEISQWLNSVWGEASQWIDQVWNDSSEWLSTIWGDASAWVTDTVDTWWADTFRTVTENSKGTWAWLQDKADCLKEQGDDLVENAQNAVAAVGDNAEETVRETAFALLDKLGIKEADAEQVWKTVYAYAEQKGISPVEAAKLALPYLMQLCADNAEQVNGGVPAVAVAQYLTGIFEKLGVTDTEAAEELVSQLKEALAGI